MVVYISLVAIVGGKGQVRMWIVISNGGLKEVILQYTSLHTARPDTAAVTGKFIQFYLNHISSKERPILFKYHNDWSWESLRK